MEFYGTQNLRSNELQNLVVHRGTSFPSPQYIGQLFYRVDPGEDKLYICTDLTPTWYELTQSFSPGVNGMILLWTKSTPIPTGWAVCDGSNGTPNLLNMFIRNTSTSSEVPGALGGTTTHDHTTPAHSHAISGLRFGNGGHASPHTNGPGGTAFAQQDHGHDFSTSTAASLAGVTNSASNLPSYVTAVYIMKI